MVTFTCDLCNESLKKNKVDQHCWKCRAESVSCVDCGVVFWGDDYKGHTECITEAEKYEKTLYKGPKKGQQVQAKGANIKSSGTPTSTTASTTSTSSANSSSTSSTVSKTNGNSKDISSINKGTENTEVKSKESAKKAKKEKKNGGKRKQSDGTDETSPKKSKTEKTQATTEATATGAATAADDDDKVAQFVQSALQGNKAGVPLKKLKKNLMKQLSLDKSKANLLLMQALLKTNVIVKAKQ